MAASAARRLGGESRSVTEDAGWRRVEGPATLQRPDLGWTEPEAAWIQESAFSLSLIIMTESENMRRENHFNVRGHSK